MHEQTGLQCKPRCNRLNFVPPESLDSMEPGSEFHEEEEVGLFSTGMVYMGCIISMIKTKVTEWTIVVSLRILRYCIH